MLRGWKLSGVNANMATTKVDPKLNESDIARTAKSYQGLTRSAAD
jgi:hypothetical protein